MSQDIRQYKALFASPSDLTEERVLFLSAIDEVNRVLGQLLKFHIEPLMWERSSASGIDSHSTQHLISSDFGDDYDVFIGAYWQKYGTPTKDADSGTEEEFNKAYARFEKNPEDVQIMFFFKDLPSVPADELDIESITKIREFKEFLKEKNVLYWRFKNASDFEALVRIQIQLRLFSGMEVTIPRIRPRMVAMNCAEKPDHKDAHCFVIATQDSPEVIRRRIQTLSETPTEEAKAQLLEEYQGLLRAAMGRIKESLKAIGGQVSLYVGILDSTVQQVLSPTPKVTLKKYKPNENDIGRSIFLVSHNLKEEWPRYIDNFKLLVQSVLKIQELAKTSLSTEELKFVSDLLESITSIQKHLKDFHTILDGIPPASIPKYQRDRTRLLTLLNDIIPTMDLQAEQISELLLMIK